MGVMNRLMNFLGLNDDEEVIEHEKIVANDETDPHPIDQRRSQKGPGNVVSIHSQKHTKVVLIEPRSYDEAQEIADHLRSRRPVVVNLQRVRKEQAVRIVDFLSGTVYALNGSISKVGANIFMCAPDNVEIQGAITDILDEEQYVRRGDS